MNLTKKNNLILLLAILGIAGFSVLYATAGIFKTNRRAVNDLTGGLVGYWTFDGADMTATQALDKSPVGTNTGTLTGTTRNIGVVGQALQLNGTSSDYVSTVNSASLQVTTGITVSVWVKRLADSGAFERIIAKSNSTAGSGACSDTRISYQMRIAAGATDVLTANIVNNSGTDYYNAGTTAIPLNQWTHAVMTYSQSDGYSRLYLNGSAEGTPVAVTGTICVNNSPLNIGRGGSDSGWLYNSNSIFDEVRVYNRALSASEITDLYNQGAKRLVKINTSSTTSLTSGLVGYWTLDGQDTTWSSASVGTTNNRGSIGGTGTLTNMSQSTSPAIGNIGQAMNFDGVNDSVLTSDSAPLSITGAMSTSFWMKASSVSTDQSIIDKYDAVAGQRSYRIAIKGVQCNANEIIFTLSSSGSPFAGAVYCSNAVLSANQWYHIVTTYTPSTSMKIYVNGADQTRALVFGSGIPASIFDSTRDLAIGAGFSNSATPNTTFFGGLIDETRVYNRTLSQSEVTELYNMGAKKLVKTNMPQTDRWPSGLVGHWSFDGKDTNWSTGRVTDSSVNVNTGILTNMSTSTSPAIGIVGQALSLDGSDDYIDIGNDSDFNFQWSDPFSISTWVYESSLDSPDFGPIIGKFDYPNKKGWVLEADDFTATFSFLLSNADFIQEQIIAYIPIIHDRWVHLAATNAGTGNNSGLNVYLDGVLQDSTKLGGPLSGADTIRNTTPVYIGQYEGDSYKAQKLDEVRIYNRALSASEVLEMYQSGVGR